MILSVLCGAGDLQLNPLTPEEERVIIHMGTERPFSGVYNKHYESGAYQCNVAGGIVPLNLHLIPGAVGRPLTMKCRARLRARRMRMAAARKLRAAVAAPILDMCFWGKGLPRKIRAIASTPFH